MYIEKKYHDEAAKLWEEIKQEEEERKAALTDAEKIAERAKIEKEAEDFVRLCEKKQRDDSNCQPGTYEDFSEAV